MIELILSMLISSIVVMALGYNLAFMKRSEQVVVQKTQMNRDSQQVMNMIGDYIQMAGYGSLSIDQNPNYRLGYTDATNAKLNGRLVDASKVPSVFATTPALCKGLNLPPSLPCYAGIMGEYDLSIFLAPDRGSAFTRYDCAGRDLLKNAVNSVDRLERPVTIKFGFDPKLQQLTCVSYGGMSGSSKTVLLDNVEAFDVMLHMDFDKENTEDIPSRVVHPNNIISFTTYRGYRPPGWTPPDPRCPISQMAGEYYFGGQSKCDPYDVAPLLGPGGENVKAVTVCMVVRTRSASKSDIGQMGLRATSANAVPRKVSPDQFNSPGNLSPGQEKYSNCFGTVNIPSNDGFVRRKLMRTFAIRSSTTQINPGSL